MGLFGRSTPPGPPPPWAAGLSPELFAMFLETVRGDLRRRGIAALIDEDAGCVAHDGGRYGLANLAQVYGQVERRDRIRVVRQHFDALLAAVAERAAIGSGWEQVRHVLKVRLYPEGLDVPALSRHVAPGLIEALAFDLPSTVEVVPPDRADAWGQPPSELFRVAYANVDEEDPPPQVARVDLGPCGDVVALTGESFFVTTRLLWVERFVEDPPQRGLLVSVPHRHVLLAYAIRDARVVPAVGRLLALTHQLHERGPGSLSRELYWWRAGELSALPHRRRGNRLEFMPPDAFVELLNELTEEA